MNLDERLHATFQRENPPEGFAERLRERISQEPIAPAKAIKRNNEIPLRTPRFRWMWPASAFAALTAVLFSVAIVNRRMEEERAGRQAVQALQIASEKLNLVRSQVLKQGVSNK